MGFLQLIPTTKHQGCSKLRLQLQTYLNGLCFRWENHKPSTGPHEGMEVHGKVSWLALRALTFLMQKFYLCG